MASIRLSIEQVRADLEEVNKEIQALESTIDPANQVVVDNLKIERDWAENYLRALEDQSLSSCPVILAPNDTELMINGS